MIKENVDVNASALSIRLRQSKNRLYLLVIIFKCSEHSKCRALILACDGSRFLWLLVQLVFPK